MAQERELVPPHPLEADQRQADQRQADQRQVDERWPVPYAILFITAASVALWSLIIAAASWLIG
jgi:hypothetical protein